MILFSRLFRKRRRAACLPLVLEGIRGKHGIEVGGPSMVFQRRKGLLPVYSRVGSLDNCNFAAHTVWEGALQEGATFVFDKGRTSGRQYVAEVSDMSPIPSARYDFVLSSHVLEHNANSLQALRELLRIIRDGWVARPVAAASRGYLRPSPPGNDPGAFHGRRRGRDG